MTELNEANFDREVLQAERPVLVDFYAPWCGPCKMLAPALDALAREFEGRARIVKVNVDDAPGLAARYEISGVPTLLFFDQGEVVDEVVGLAPPRTLQARLEKLAGAAPADHPTITTIQ
jgi:thioredoxin 1